jgi:hypothetical protein
LCLDGSSDFEVLGNPLRERLFGRLFMRELLASLTPSGGVICLFAA